MALQLTASEVRVLGSLIEKELATPDYYPLTLAALLNACNQKTNRDPVVSYDEQTVSEALDGLIGKQLVLKTQGSRAVKYEELFLGSRNFVSREAALLCMLMLRGPQTPGELRGRTERMHAFADIEALHEALEDLVEFGLAVKLPRQAGRKEARYTHLFSGAPDPEAHAAAGPEASAAVRLAALEAQVADLRATLDALAHRLDEFTRQFE